MVVILIVDFLHTQIIEFSFTYSPPQVTVIAL